MQNVFGERFANFRALLRGELVASFDPKNRQIRSQDGLGRRVRRRYTEIAKILDLSRAGNYGLFF